MSRHYSAALPCAVVSRNSVVVSLASVGVRPQHLGRLLPSSDPLRILQSQVVTQPLNFMGRCNTGKCMHASRHNERLFSARTNGNASFLIRARRCDPSRRRLLVCRLAQLGQTVWRSTVRQLGSQADGDEPLQMSSAAAHDLRSPSQHLRAYARPTAPCQANHFCYRPAHFSPKRRQAFS
jgi:hypothetical protein